MNYPYKNDRKWYVKNDVYHWKLTKVLTSYYMQIKSRSKIKGSKTEVFWGNVTLNNKIKINGSGNVTAHQHPGFARIFKKVVSVIESPT